jgi:hypothetical protein
MIKNRNKQFFLHGVGNRFFQAVKIIFKERYLENSDYGKFQMILFVFNLSLLAILISRHLKDLLLCFQ